MMVLLLYLSDDAAGDALGKIQGPNSFDRKAEGAIGVDMLHCIFSRVIVQGSPKDVKQRLQTSGTMLDGGGSEAKLSL